MQPGCFVPPCIFSLPQGWREAQVPDDLQGAQSLLVMTPGLGASTLQAWLWGGAHPVLEDK
jgi:hypothetical protein